MSSKIIITGPPRCGKSTLISRLIDYYRKENLNIYGFSTPEVRKGGIRIGFDIIDINSGKKIPLARAGIYNTKFKLGKYSVFIKEFNKYLNESLNIEENHLDILIIDEIGKMELFSEKFQEFIKRSFNSETQIIATIGEKIKHPIKNYILNLPKVMLFNLTRKNQQEVFQEIISQIS